MSKQAKILRIFSVFLNGIALAIFFGIYAYATQGDFVEFEGDCNIEIVGEPQLGEPFEVVFTFTPLHDIIHTRGITDSAILKSDKGVEFVGGDTIWTGYLENGITNSIKAMYIINNSINFRFKGRVTAIQAMGLAAYPIGMADQGAKAYNGATSKLIKILGSVPDQETTDKYTSPDGNYEIEKIDLPLCILDSLKGPIAPVIAKMSVEDIINTEPESKIITPKAIDTNYVFLNIHSIDDRDTVIINPVKYNVLVIPKMENDIEIKSDSLLIKKINDSTFIIKVKGNLSPL